MNWAVNLPVNLPVNLLVHWRHLQAFLWLRWRLAVNQWRRAGTLNAVLMMIIAVTMTATAVPLFVGCIAVGIFAFDEARPVHVLYVWDGLVVVFVFCWMIGLITDLQRTEPLSLSKFLHLPVSVNAAFLINYVSSLLRLTLIVFAPAMFGLSLGLVVSRGPMLIIVLPAVAAFLLMITALTYQFQGWLASLMTNPRRRRTVVVVTTTLFILLMQLPNLVNLMRPWGKSAPANPPAAIAGEYAELDRALQAGEISQQEYFRRRQEAAERQQQTFGEGQQATAAELEQTVRLVNMALPLGWLPLGAMGAMAGNALPALLGILGMALIGTASLWRAYRTTVRLYQGDFTTGKPRPATANVKPAPGGMPGVLLLERRLIGCSEPVAAVALGSLRSLLRSPEARMMLFSLVAMGVVYGLVVFRVPRNLPQLVRPLIATGGIFAVLLGIVQLMANQFGFDRDGFRVFVLCAASRRDILLGKNLAFAVLAAFGAIIDLVVVESLLPMRLPHLLALIPQAVSMYLLFCLVMNLLSIYAPMHIAAGSLKPANPKLVPILLQMLVMTCVFPLTQAPLLLPLGIEALLESWDSTHRFPVYLPLAVVECAVMVVLYRVLLNWEGKLLESREKKILECVTKQ